MANYKATYCVKCKAKLAAPFPVEMCCDGYECGCRGLPVEPPLCEMCALLLVARPEPIKESDKVSEDG